MDGDGYVAELYTSGSQCLAHVVWWSTLNYSTYPLASRVREGGTERDLIELGDQKF